MVGTKLKIVSRNPYDRSKEIKDKSRKIYYNVTAFSKSIYESLFTNNKVVNLI